MGPVDTVFSVALKYGTLDVLLSIVQDYVDNGHGVQRTPGLCGLDS